MVRRHCMARGWAALMAVVLCACGGPTVDDSGGASSSSGGSGGQDGGTPGGADGSASADAGVLGDAGLGVDGGVTQDAGPQPDASAQADAGTVRLWTHYTPDRVHSPITPEVAQNLRDIAARAPALREDVFSKVGDSLTEDVNFARCFAGSNVDLDGRTQLQSTLDHFGAATVGTTTPFDRPSLAAQIGWSAWAPLSGDPLPLQQELDATQPRYAVVMFGTNDVEVHNPFTYADNMMDLVDYLVDRGVVPIITNVPPRDDDSAANAYVPRYNNVARAVAYARMLPFVDLHQLVLPIPQHGLGPDGVHFNVYTVGGAARGCVLTAQGLDKGSNQRNLATLEALDRVHRVLGLEEPPPDAAVPGSGDGSRQSPFLIKHLPFVASANTALGGFDDVDTYDGCVNTDESGNAFTWKITLSQTTTLRAMVLDRGEVDVDVHLLDASNTPQGCLDRGHREIVNTLAPGTYHYALDTFVSAGQALAGEFQFVLLAE